METIKELNTKELEQVAGGNAFCIVIGVSGGPEANACALPGAGSGEDEIGIGFDACAFLGIGIGVNVNE